MNSYAVKYTHSSGESRTMSWPEPRKLKPHCSRVFWKVTVIEVEGTPPEINQVRRSFTFDNWDEAEAFMAKMYAPFRTITYELSARTRVYCPAADGVDP